MKYFSQKLCSAEENDQTSPLKPFPVSSVGELSYTTSQIALHFMVPVLYGNSEIGAHVGSNMESSHK